MLFGDDNDSDLVLLGLKCLVMKMGLVMLEYHDLETHLNRISQAADLGCCQIRCHPGETAWMFVEPLVLYKSKVADLENSFLRDRCGKTGGLG